jgi:hypothetical protein
MEINNNIYFDDLIKNTIFSYLPKNKFKEGQFYTPMNFYDYELCDTVVEDYKFIITKMTKHFIFLKIQLQPDEEPLIFKKKIKIDKEGEYIKFIDSFNVNKNESLLYLNTFLFFNCPFFRPEFLNNKKNT